MNSFYGSKIFRWKNIFMCVQNDLYNKCDTKKFFYVQSISTDVFEWRVSYFVGELLLIFCCSIHIQAIIHVENEESDLILYEYVIVIRVKYFHQEHSVNPAFSRKCNRNWKFNAAIVIRNFRFSKLRFVFTSNYLFIRKKKHFTNDLSRQDECNYLNIVVRFSPMTNCHV